MPAWVAPPDPQPVSNVADTVAMPVFTDGDENAHVSRVADTVAMPVPKQDGAAAQVSRVADTIAMPTMVAHATHEPPTIAVATRHPAASPSNVSTGLQQPVSRVSETVAMPAVDAARDFATQATRVPEDADALSAIEPVLVRHRASVTTRRDSAPHHDVGPRAEPGPIAEPPATRPRTPAERGPTVVESAARSWAVPADWRFGLWSTAAWLLLALALPTDAAPPWKLLVQPTGVAFHALMLLLLVVAVGAAGLAPRGWRIGVSVVGIVGLGLSWLVMRDVVAVDQFDTQPGITALWQGAGAGGALAALALSLLAGAAIARGGARKGAGPSILAVLGLVAGALVAAGIALPAGHHLGAVFETLGGSPFQGDRIGAVMVVVVLAAAVVAFVASFPGMPALFARVAGWALALLAALPAILLAAFVASDVGPTLAPLKAAAFIAGCVWLAVTAFGSWFARET
jgi:hypothetical protein